MANSGLFTLYDKENNTYNFYYIKSDSLTILREIRGKFAAAKSIKAIYLVIANAVEVGHLGLEFLTQSDQPRSHAECWSWLDGESFTDFTMTLTMDNKSTD